MNGLLSFYDRGPLTPEERYQAALQARIAEAQGMLGGLDERMSDYIQYPTGFNSDNPLVIYPTAMYNGLLGLLRGENLRNMASDADMLRAYISSEGRQVNRLKPSMSNLTTPSDAQDVRPLPILRSK